MYGMRIWRCPHRILRYIEKQYSGISWDLKIVRTISWTCIYIVN
jgi:hypothetical protein